MCPSRWGSPAGPTATTRSRWTRLLVAGLGCVLAAACTSPDRQEATATSQAGGADPAGLLAHGRLADRRPREEGMDPAVLDDLDTNVPDLPPGAQSAGGAPRLPGL